MIQLITPFLNFLWDFVNIKYVFAGYQISLFMIFAWSAVIGTMIKLFKGGGYSSE